MATEPADRIKTTIYWRPDDKAAMERLAREHSRSLNQEVEWALRQYVLSAAPQPPLDPPD